MAKIANVATSDTFGTWRTRSNAAGGSAGIGHDSTSAFSGRSTFNTNPSGANGGVIPMSGRHDVKALGYHYMQACEYGGINGGTDTWFGDNGSAYTQSGLSYRGMF